jgi:hypothetical protein
VLEVVEDPQLLFGWGIGQPEFSEEITAEVSQRFQLRGQRLPAHLLLSRRRSRRSRRRRSRLACSSRCSSNVVRGDVALVSSCSDSSSDDCLGRVRGAFQAQS